MSIQLQELLHEIRRGLIRDNDVEGVDAVVDLLAATAVVDELCAAMWRNDDHGVVFHAELLEQLLAGARPLRFDVVDR
jgi:hypothetical protein